MAAPQYPSLRLSGHKDKSHRHRMLANFVPGSRILDSCVTLRKIIQVKTPQLEELITLWHRSFGSSGEAFLRGVARPFSLPPPTSTGIKSVSGSVDLN
jgi:hypothetical protein